MTYTQLSFDQWNDGSRIAWESNIINRIVELCECDNSDAQGIVEAQDAALRECWANSLGSDASAQVIFKASIVH